MDSRTGEANRMRTQTRQGARQGSSRTGHRNGAIIPSAHLRPCGCAPPSAGAPDCSRRQCSSIRTITPALTTRHHCTAVTRPPIRPSPSERIQPHRSAAQPSSPLPSPLALRPASRHVWHWSCIGPRGRQRTGAPLSRQAARTRRRRRALRSGRHRRRDGTAAAAAEQ